MVPTEPQLRSASGQVRILLRAEGLVVVLAAIAAFHALGQSWWIFAALCLAPDVSFVGYVFGPRAGAWTYNSAHTYVLPILVVLLSYATGQAEVVAGALVWIAHIGVDRMLGYGLKYPTAFADTHLGIIGRAGRGGAGSEFGPG